MREVPEKRGLVYMMGLPASGKSTKAKQMVLDNAVTGPGMKRINFDLLREMLDYGKWSKQNEKFIRDVTRAICNEAKRSGYNVILDNTGLSQSQKTLAQSICYDMGFEKRVVDMTDVPLQTCLDRDEKRGDKAVGRKVILEMYRDYVANNTFLADVEGLPSCIIVDIDGTVAGDNGHNKYDPTKYYLCPIRKHVVAAIRGMVAVYPENKKPMVMVVSGREDIGVARQQTMDWLSVAECFGDMNNWRLLMRENGDHRKDSEVKKEIFNKNILGEYNVLAVFDDREQVVRDCWDTLGLGDRVFRCGRIDMDGF